MRLAREAETIVTNYSLAAIGAVRRCLDQGLLGQFPFMTPGLVGAWKLELT